RSPRASPRSWSPPRKRPAEGSPHRPGGAAATMNRPPQILLGVSGGIAAYKSAEIVRALVQRGASVRVAMTRGAREFVAPLTFSVLSGHEVYTEVWEGKGVEHVNAADWADLLLVAPATAHTLAKFANGFADDFLSTYFLAHRGPVLLAP